MVTHFKNKLAATFGRHNNSINNAMLTNFTEHNGLLNANFGKSKARIKNARLKTGLIAG